MSDLMCLCGKESADLPAPLAALVWPCTQCRLVFDLCEKPDEHAAICESWHDMAVVCDEVIRTANGSTVKLLDLRQRIKTMYKVTLEGFFNRSTADTYPPGFGVPAKKESR